mgnify:CR=1
MRQTHNHSIDTVVVRAQNNIFSLLFRLSLDPRAEQDVRTDLNELRGTSHLPQDILAALVSLPSSK